MCYQFYHLLSNLLGILNTGSSSIRWFKRVILESEKEVFIV